MATIRQRGAHSWQIRVLGPSIAGAAPERFHKTIKITDPHILASKRRTQQHLDAQAAAFQAQVLAGEWQAAAQAEAAAPTPAPDTTEEPAGSMTVGQFAQRWQEEHVGLNLEPNSQQNYRHFLTRWILPVFEQLPMDQVRPMHITQFLAGMRKPGAGLRGGTVGDATVIYCYRVLRGLFTCAHEWQVITTNPMAGIRKPRENHRPDVAFYDETELATLGQALASERPELQAAVLLAVAGGMRRAEICGLQWQHIDFDTGELSVRQSIPKYVNGQPHIKAPKTKSSMRRIIMPLAVANALQAHKATQATSVHRPGAETQAPDNWAGASDFVFCHPSGRPVDPQRITKWWLEFHRQHGLRKIRFHDLRHTAAAWLIRTNQHPKTVAGMLGHAQIKTSMDTYGHLMPSLYQQAATAMDAMPLGPPSITLPPAPQDTPADSPPLH